VYGYRLEREESIEQNYAPRAYREYLSDEQRGQAGCIGGQDWCSYSWTGPWRQLSSLPAKYSATTRVPCGVICVTAYHSDAHPEDW
jgi:hypothetical protein